MCKIMKNDKPMLNNRSYRIISSLILSYLFSVIIVACNGTSRSEDIRTVQVGNVSFNMVYVEGGTFTMGCTNEQEGDCDDEEKPAHKVTLSSYYIGETEVTQALWKEVMGYNPSRWEGDSMPVESVSWEHCQEFVRELNSRTGRHFTLPTEAQWEFAARGGNKSLGYKYSGSNNIDDVAWFFANSDDKTHPAELVYGDMEGWYYDKHWKTRNVKSKKPNELGLYDMSGNVMEWCSDEFDKYTAESQFNPTGSAHEFANVLRGGCWETDAFYCRVSFRAEGSPSDFYDLSDFGLRLVLQL